MISSPYEVVKSKVQDGVVDCTLVEGILWTSGIGLLFEACSSTITLYVDVDKGNIPMVVKENGYEWTPVYTRKLT